MKIELVKDFGEFEKESLGLIGEFWLSHSGSLPTLEEVKEDYKTYIGEGSSLYLIKFGEDFVGFAVLGARGQAKDWLEYLFIRKEFQNQGIGSRALKLLEDKVENYSDSLYIEVASWNERALSFYKKNGYDILNTVSLRKDFKLEHFETILSMSLFGQDFEIRRRKKNS